MTIKELYTLAKAAGAEDYEIKVGVTDIFIICGYSLKSG